MTDNQLYPGTYDGLVRLVERLRGPEGCPWDREQTHESLISEFLEECYELVEAVELGDPKSLAEELGDVLFHLLFQVQLGTEAGSFNQGQVLQSLVGKLVRRHPHVFGDVEVSDARQVKDNWEAIKLKEKADDDVSILVGVPRQMPALAYAQEMQERAARVGFDWEDLRGVLDKVSEELNEMDTAESEAERESEFGDLLFSVVNAARWLGIDAEGALRKANGRFRRRFGTMESLSRERGLSFVDLPLDRKEMLWAEAKLSEG